MTNFEIDYALAVAIGWSEKSDDPDVQVFDPSSRWTARVVVWHAEKWQTFSHKDPAVIFPIATRLGIFPDAIVSGNLRATHSEIVGWECNAWSYKRKRWVHVEADTAATAIALAVIESLK